MLAVPHRGDACSSLCRGHHTRHRPCSPLGAGTFLAVSWKSGNPPLPRITRYMCRAHQAPLYPAATCIGIILNTQSVKLVRRENYHILPELSIRPKSGRETEAGGPFPERSSRSFPFFTRSTPTPHLPHCQRRCSSFYATSHRYSARSSSRSVSVVVETSPHVKPTALRGRLVDLLPSYKQHACLQV